MKEAKSLIKIANRIQQALMNLRKQRYLESLSRLAGLVGQFKELGIESRKLGLSLTRNWLLAADRCCTRASRLLNDIPYSVSRINQLIKEPLKQSPKLSVLLDELNELQQEFGEIDFDNAENTLSVVTEPIELEGIYLGPFKIQLELSRLSELYKSCIYHVIALDPNPAATDEAVTHPHVSNEQLCEGDGAVAIRASLEQGRLSDFFTMIRSILNTYNPDSPYVSLHDWDGEPCYDCGYVMDRENTYYCNFCNRDFCEECSTYCPSCDETMCLGCAGRCEVCEEPICSNCACSCTECGSICCESCLNEDLCPDCKKEMEKENEEQEIQINRSEPDKSQSQPETSSTEIKLAS